ncbi:unnamed protein product [Urochloa humidicola]
MASARVTRSKRARLGGAPPPAAAAAAAANDGVLPTEILHDILLRLPIKALYRLRLVCRAWRALTSDPGFARAHSSQCRRRQLVVAGVCKLRGEIKFVDLFSGEVVKRVPVDEAQVKYGHNLSAQADYVCISETERPTCVVNVATGAVTVLPTTSVIVKRHAAVDTVTTGNTRFAVCQEHTAKPERHTAKLFAVCKIAHGKLYDGKQLFAVCQTTGTR